MANDLSINRCDIVLQPPILYRKSEASNLYQIEASLVQTYIVRTSITSTVAIMAQAQAEK
jgi:hypothetical protein